MNATPLISSTRASASVRLLMKFAVIAIANLPLNSFRLNPSNVFLFPSAPISTSNSYWDTGWSAGVVFALQPISGKTIREFLFFPRKSFMEFVLLSYFSRARVKLRSPTRRFEKSLVSNEILRKILYPFSKKLFYRHLLPSSWFSGGDTRASKLTLSWNSTPRIKATLSNIHWSCRMLMWSMEPAQNFPKNFFAPRARRSWMTKGHRWRTLFLDMRSRFSTTTTLAPNSWASMAERRPHGPPPMINTCEIYFMESSKLHEVILEDCWFKYPWGWAYPSVRARFATIVTFVVGPLIEFLPEGLSLPRSQFRFQFWIKLIDHVWPDPEQVAEMPVVAQNWFQCGRVAKQIELLVSFRYLRAHRLLPMLHFLSSCPSCFRVSLSLPKTIFLFSHSRCKNSRNLFWFSNFSKI